VSTPELSDSGPCGRSEVPLPKAGTAESDGATEMAQRLRDAGDKAKILAEALPYIREFSGRRVVIKYGGHAMEKPELADLFATDVVLMRLVGMNPIVVHGGGPQITALMRKLGKEPEFVDGRRVTDTETIDIVRMALVGKVNREIVASVNRHGPYSVGLSGEDAGLIRVDQRDPKLGFVGDVRAIDPTIVLRLVREELIPVIATVGVDDTGQAYNVNADTVAGAIAEAVDAEKLVYLTDVAGVYADWPDATSLISRIDVDGLEQLLADGKVSEGMIPKLESCVAALRYGVRRAHILDGRLPHALLLEFFTREGVGTMVQPPGAGRMPGETGDSPSPLEGRRS
jgi:acetylglutamate kinase